MFSDRCFIIKTVSNLVPDQASQFAAYDFVLNYLYNGHYCSVSNGLLGEKMTFLTSFNFRIIDTAIKLRLPV